MRLPLAISALILVAAAPRPANAPIEVPVQLAVPSQTPMSGRLIVFAELAKPGEKMPDSVDANPFSGTPTAVAARDVAALSPGQIATVDGDADSVPEAWSKLAPGQYHIQAVLDVNNNYNYGGRDAGDVVSDVADVTLPGPIVPLRLSTILPSTDPLVAPNAQMKSLVPFLPKVVPIDFVSPRLSAFWGRPIHMRGSIALPPNYVASGSKTWPAVYQTHGFGGSAASARWTAAARLKLMSEGAIPPMIWVALDESSPTGTHEFAELGEQWSLGRCPDDRVDPVAREELPDGCAALGTLPDRPFLRWLGDTLAANALSGDFRRHLVHLARSQRFP